MALVPVQPLLAVQDVGLFVALHVNVLDCPLVIDVGLANMVATGAGVVTLSVQVA